jgi:ATP-citrate lyase beta-subunit
VARKKLSEHRAKSLLYASLGIEYQGVELDSQADWHSEVNKLNNGWKYVIKVDQAEKGRFKKGLVKLDRTKESITTSAEELFSKGYRYLLVEPQLDHDQSEERYFSVERTREGLKVSYSSQGGIDVEENPDSIRSAIHGQGNIGDLPEAALESIIRTFDDNYFSFLEINPLVIDGDKLDLLDAAAEADSEAIFFEDNWKEEDIRRPLSRGMTEEEIAVLELASQSQAAFSLEVINPGGSIFLLLSGGGASVVVADEVNNLGFGKELGNYGEYSGNPSLEETRHYTEQIVKLALKSEGKNKVIIIGGGVANFTDIRATFKGITDAFQNHEDEMKQQGIKVFVRRGGPYQKEGLAAMKDYLEKSGLYGHVAGPELILTDIVSLALKGKPA